MAKFINVSRTVALILILILTFGFAVFAEPENGNTETAPAETTQAQQTTESRAQTNTQARSNSASSNNELTSLRVVGKKQDGTSVEIALSPEFKRSTRTYSISVPFDVESLEIEAVAADGNAKIEIPQGYLKLDVGENKSYVYVTAQNGSRRTYLINSVRAAEETTVTEATTAEPETETVTETQPSAPTEAVSVDAQPVEVKSTSGIYNKLAIAFGAVGAVLLVVAIILFIRNKRLREGRF